MNEIKFGANVVPPHYHFNSLSFQATSVLPLVSQLLGVGQEDIKILDNVVPAYTVSSCPKDQILNSMSVYGLPIIGVENNGLHCRAPHAADGLILYQAHSDKSLKYVYYARKTSQGVFATCFVPKTKVFKFVRHQTKMSFMHKVTKPTLPESLINDVVKNSILFIKKIKQFQSLGVKPNRGLMFAGSPGNGKTMLCKWLHHLCMARSIVFATVTSSTIMKAFKDDGLENLLRRPGITIFDDIDLSFLSRNADSRMACTFASALDGPSFSDEPCVRIFTTNEDPKMIDAAFLRPGRIDKWITFEKPSRKQRQSFLQSWNIDVVTDNIEKILDTTIDFSFAELDYIRNILVSNFIADEVWDIRVAFEEYYKYKPDIGQSKLQNIGFANNIV